jgi:hypothetical protein
MKNALVIVTLPFAGIVCANPIPLPVPASMPLEEMSIHIDGTGHAGFQGRFTFDFIPGDVQEMLFPLPPANATNIQVTQDSVALPWALALDTYPTVLPEYPDLSMFMWSGPFPEAGAVFGVNYEHDLFQRGQQSVLFYSLGTGKYFPTYDKITTAVLDIGFPSYYSVIDILLDGTTVDPSLYSLTDTRLNMTLTSEFGPFNKDLIVVFVPEPTTLWLLGFGLLGMAGMVKRRNAACSEFCTNTS